MKYTKIEGDLIKLALEGKFEVIAHGCNCWNLQRAGIANQMRKTFDTQGRAFKLEESWRTMYYPQCPDNIGDINKLGQIEWAYYILNKELNMQGLAWDSKKDVEWIEKAKVNYLSVVNAYTQFNPGKDASYDAVRMCFKKMNHIFKGKHIGLPKIGCGIGGLQWPIVEQIIKDEFTDCDITVVEYKP